MKRNRLPAEIPERTGALPSTCRDVVEALTAVIVERMRAGLPLRLMRFGTFAPATREARVGRDPRSGRAIRVPARTTVRLRPARRCAMRCAAGRPMRRAALAAAVASMVAAAATATVPDNRGLALDPDDPLSPAYGESLEERENARLRDARDTGGSFVPLAHGEVEARETEAAPAAAAPPEPLPETVPPAAPAAPEPAYERYAGPAAESAALPAMLDALIEAWNAPPAIVRVRYPPREAPAPEEGNAPGIRRGGGAPEIPELAAVRAGDGLYARAVYAIESDYPGPVFLEVLEPPLAGARLTGAFTLVRHRLALRLTAIEHRGIRAPVDAWAVGLDCACYGVAGAVDRHWLERVLLPAAVRFAQGFLASAGRPEETVRIDGAGTVYERRRATRRQDLLAGAAEAVGAAGDVLLEDAPSRPTVHIARDAELIVVFAGVAAAATAPGERPDG